MNIDGKLTINQKKTPEYALASCQHLVAMPDAISVPLKQKIAVNKRYSQGTQSPERYANIYRNKISTTGYDKYFKVEDIDFTPMGLCRLIYDSIYARLNKVDSFTSIELVDEKSKDEKMTAIYEKIAKMELRQPIQQILGYDILPANEPQNYDEIEMYKEIGYKNTIELLLEKHVSVINNNNNFTFEIEPTINDNLIVSGLCASHLFYDDDGSIIEEPILIEDLKIIGGTKRDYSDATGFMIDKKFNVEDFFQMVKGSITVIGVDEPTEEQLKKAQYAEYEKIKGCKDPEGNISVKLCYWATWDSYNNKVVFNENNDPFIRPHKGAADTSARVHRWYMAYYVPQSSSVYNYGAMPNQSRKKTNGYFKESFCPVSVIRGIDRDLSTTTSVMSVVKKFEDMATIIWTKLQNEVARIKPTRVNIDISSAEKVVEKMKVVYPDMDITHLIQALNLGLGLSASTDVEGEGVRNPQPFTTTPHPAGIMNEFFVVINQCMDLCFYFAGVPRIDAGVEQNPRISNVQTQLSLSGADKAILRLLQNKDELIRLSAEKKMNMVVRLYQSSDKLPNPYASMFDDYEVELLKDIDFLISREYNVKIEKGFSEEEMANIKNDILLLNNRYRETGGKEGISIEEMLQIQMWLKENPKLAIYKIQMMKNKKKREQEAQAKEAMRQNQELQMQSAEQSQQAQQQMMQMEMGLQKMNENFQKEFAELKSNLKINEEISVKSFEAGLEANEPANTRV